MNQSDPVKVLENSVLIANSQEVEAAIERMAVAINAHYEDQPIILLAVMTGAIMPTAWLATRLKMPLQMDFIHATRYAGQTEGGELDFRVPPRLNLQDHDVLIVDDIYDIGLTLQLIEKYCASRGARSVNSETTALLARWVAGRLPDPRAIEVQA